MKKMSIMFGGLMMMSSIAFAGPAPLLATADMSVSLKDKVVRVHYRSDKAGKVVVTIYNAVTGKEVFTEAIKKATGFVRPYNLEALPFGDYFIVLEDENGRAVEKISYTDSKRVEVLSSIIQNKEKFGCTVALFSKGETTVTVNILDDAGQALFSDNRKVNGQATRAYDLSELKGAVTIEVRDSNGLVQSRTITK